MSNYFIIIATGGIGNRLLGLFDGLAIYNKYFKSRKLILYWPCMPNISKNEMIKLMYNEIEKSDNRFEMYGYNFTLNFFHLHCCISFNCDLKTIFSFDIDCKYETDLNFLQIVNKNDIKFVDHQTYKLNFDIQTPFLLFKSNGKKILKTIKDMKKVAENINLKFTNNIKKCKLNRDVEYALHLRFSDRFGAVSIDSKVKKIILNFDKLLKKKLYICSDEQEVLNKLKMMYKNIVTYPINTYIEKIDNSLPWKAVPFNDNRLNLVYNVFRSNESCIDSIKELYFLSQYPAESNLSKSTFYILSRVFYTY